MGWGFGLAPFSFRLLFILFCGGLLFPLPGTRIRSLRRAAKLVCALGALCLLGWAGLGLIAPPPLLEGVPFGSVVLDANGGIMRISRAEDGIFRLRVTLDDVAPSAVDALLRYEDRHFFRHPGVNPLSLLRAAWSTYVSGGRRVGGSTITMQVARMRLRLDTSGIGGKLRQIGMALLLERHYDKQDILEAYFNLAPYGGNIEGIEAASRIYFDAPAARLTESESLALTVVPQNPIRRNPVHGRDFDAARARFLRLCREESDGAAPVSPPLRVRPLSRLPFRAPHVSTELLAEAGQERILSTIEPDLQTLLESCLASYTARHRRFGIRNASAMLVHAPSIKVCALAGSADFFDSTIDGQVDGTKARRSPGSTLKPFIYALALDQGLIHPMTLLIDSPRSFGGYDPENFDKGFRGPVHAHEALKASRNLPAIILAEQLEEPGLYGFLQKAQVRLPETPEHYGLALVLGGAELTMRELAGLYAMLINQGLWHPLRLRQDAPLEAPVRLLSPEAAFVTLRMLEGGSLPMREGRLPLRCKTGTSNGFRDAWTAGVVGEYVLLVWVGNFDGASNPFFVGARAAQPLFMEAAQALAALRPLHDLLPSQRPGLDLADIPVCTSTGDVDVSRCTETTETLFLPGISPIRDSGILRPIRIDKATGLRACEAVHGETEEQFWEFWPSDLRLIFAQAGILKAPPPDWHPLCAGREDSMQEGGRPPRILYPKKHVTYYRNLDKGGRSIPLAASADQGVERLHWFAGSAYLGSSAPDEPFLWEPAASGTVDIVAVDDKGRSSQVRCRIMLAP